MTTKLRLAGLWILSAALYLTPASEVRAGNASFGSSLSSAPRFAVINQPAADFANDSSRKNVRYSVGDFDGDGLADVALTGVAGWRTLPVAFSNGDGSFDYRNLKLTQSEFVDWAKATSVVVLVGDFDGNGSDDLALFAGTGWTSIPIAYSDRKRGFSVVNHECAADPAEHRPSCSEFAGFAREENVSALVGNFDGQRGDDVALVGGIGWNSIPLLLGGPLERPLSLRNDHPEGIRTFTADAARLKVRHLAGDFDQDGRTDIALLGAADWSTIPVAFSGGGGTFSATDRAPINGAQFQRWSAERTTEIMVGDFDGENGDDIALTGNPHWTTLPLLLSHGRVKRGEFAETNEEVGEFAVWASRGRVHSGDFNCDGRAEIVLTGGPNWSTVPVAIFESQSWKVSNSSVVRFGDWAAATDAHSLSGDFNGDGRVDLLLLGKSTWKSTPVAFAISRATRCIPCADTTGSR